MNMDETIEQPKQKRKYTMKEGVKYGRPRKTIPSVEEQSMNKENNMS